MLAITVGSAVYVVPTAPATAVRIIAAGIPGLIQEPAAIAPHLATSGAQAPLLEPAPTRAPAPSEAIPIPASQTPDHPTPAPALAPPTPTPAVPSLRVDGGRAAVAALTVAAKQAGKVVAAVSHLCGLLCSNNQGGSSSSRRPPQRKDLGGRKRKYMDGHVD